jgi:hypothetical protein
MVNCLSVRSGDIYRFAVECHLDGAVAFCGKVHRKTELFRAVFHDLCVKCFLGAALFAEIIIFFEASIEIGATTLGFFCPLGLTLELDLVIRFTEKAAVKTSGILSAETKMVANLFQCGEIINHTFEFNKPTFVSVFLIESSDLALSTHFHTTSPFCSHGAVFGGSFTPHKHLFSFKQKNKRNYLNSHYKAIIIYPQPTTTMKCQSIKTHHVCPVVNAFLSQSTTKLTRQNEILLFYNIPLLPSIQYWLA